MSDSPPPPAEIEHTDFTEFFIANYADLVQSVSWLTGNLDQSREICQEAFARLFIKWEKVRKYEFPLAWVRKVAIRIANRNKWQRSREVLGEVPIISSPSAEFVGVVLDVKHAIEQLPVNQKSAILLHYFYDLPVSEVANELGCRQSTAKVHLHRARETLRNLLSAYGK